MNKKVAKILAETIGKVVEIPLEPKDCWGKFLRVKARIDVSKPLKRGLRVWLFDFQMIVIVLLRYERLSEFCFACGLLGRSIQECSNKKARMEAIDSAAPKFGEWLRAPISERLNARTQCGYSIYIWKIFLLKKHNSCEINEPIMKSQVQN
ncbi:hypothetical protein ACOSQ3_024894 [Xanthoceras sorbifolium]